MAKHYKHMCRKLKDGVNFKLRGNFTNDKAYGVVNDALIATVKQYEKNPQAFQSQRDFFAYWLVTGWRTYRNQNMKLSKMVRDIDNEADFGHRQRIEVPLEELIFELADTEAAEETEESEFQELLRDEEFGAFVHERVYDYLDDCYLDGAFSLRDISIFKIYCVHNYSIQRMVEETTFGRTAIVTALAKIKKHLATVDFRWHQFRTRQ